MPDLRLAATQALEALKKSHPYSNSDRDLDKHSEAIHALRAALAEPCEMGAMCLNCQPRGPNGECPDAPQPRRRLTDEEIAVIYLDTAEETSGGLRRMKAFARAIELAHGIGEQE